MFLAQCFADKSDAYAPPPNKYDRHKNHYTSNRDPNWFNNPDSHFKPAVENHLHLFENGHHVCFCACPMFPQNKQNSHEILWPLSTQSQNTKCNSESHKTRCLNAAKCSPWASMVYGDWELSRGCCTCAASRRQNQHMKIIEDNNVCCRPFLSFTHNVAKHAEKSGAIKRRSIGGWHWWKA